MKTYTNDIAVEIDTAKCLQANHAVANIAGTVTNVYHGKKYTYVTVRVTDNSGYCDYKIACNKDSKCKIGDVVSVNCTIKQFYDSDKKSFITTFYEN